MIRAVVPTVLLSGTKPLWLKFFISQSGFGIQQHWVKKAAQTAKRSHHLRDDWKLSCKTVRLFLAFCETYFSDKYNYLVLKRLQNFRAKKKNTIGLIFLVEKCLWIRSCFDSSSKEPWVDVGSSTYSVVSPHRFSQSSTVSLVPHRAASRGFTKYFSIRKQNPFGGEETTKSRQA